MPLWATICGSYLHFVFQKTTDPEHIKTMTMLLRGMLQKQAGNYARKYQSFWDNGGGMKLDTVDAEGGGDLKILKLCLCLQMIIFLIDQNSD